MKLFHYMTIGLTLLMGNTLANAATTPDPVTFAVGTAQIMALQDMPGQMDISIFRGAPAEELKKHAPSGKVDAGVSVFYVVSGGKKILIDSGYGINKTPDVSALPAMLQKIGVQPETIDIVLLTHMHTDHIGGLLHDGKAYFPNAQIKVNKLELAFWTGKETKKAYPDLARYIDVIDKVCAAYGKKITTFVSGNEVAPGIIARDTPGHTPGHTLFMLSSGKDKMYFWGDLVHGAALQFANPDICAIYDMNMPKAATIRREIMAEAAKKNIPVAGAHLPWPAVGRVAKDKTTQGFVYLPGIK